MGGRTERANVKPPARGSPEGSPPRALAAPVSAPYWLAWFRGRSRGKHLPLGGPLDPASCSPAEFQSWAPSATRSCSASRLQVGAPTTCSALRPGKRGRERREGGRRWGEEEEERGSLHTPSSPSTQSSPETAAVAAAFAATALPPEETAWTRRPCGHPRRFLPSTGLFMHTATTIIIIIPREGEQQTSLKEPRTPF